MYHIVKPDLSIQPVLIEKINQKTKPLGALGQLESLALQIGTVQNSLSPALTRPVVMVFAGDHGIAQAGVSAYPADVTAQMVLNFLAGGAAINVFAKQQHFLLRIIDSGVNYAFADSIQNLINAKIAFGTANFLQQAAMTREQCQLAIEKGAALALQEIAAGSNILAFGEMGIGNTSSAAALMAVLTRLAVSECVGRGTGLDDAGLARKIALINQALQDRQVDTNDAIAVLSCFGGFEIAMMVGAMLAAASQQVLIIVDGFIASAALLVAYQMQPAILSYAIFAHTSHESGHQRLLTYLGVKPLLNLDLRLGEGTGAVLAYPLIQAAVGFLNDMASFASAHVSTETNPAV